MSTAEKQMAASDTPTVLVAPSSEYDEASGSSETSGDDNNSISNHEVDANIDGTSSSPPPLPRRRYHGLMPRPNCTHIVMDYFYTTDVPCDNCGLPPRLGWLYMCQQDHYSEAIARRQMDSLNRINEKEQVTNRIEELQACGVSRSILDQIKQGNVYDPFQIEVLRNQKINMLRVMDNQLSREHEPWNITSNDFANASSESHERRKDNLSRNVTMRTSVRVAKAAATKIVQKLGHFRRRSQAVPKCSFKCCHACRPYLRDRAYISLGAVVMDDIIPEKFSFSAPSVSNVSDVENLGLRRSYQPRFRTSQDSDDDLSDTSVTCSTDSNASEYYLVTDTIATPAAPSSRASTSGILGDDRPLSQRSPSYSDKLQARASPPSLYTNHRDPEPSAKNHITTADSVYRHLKNNSTPRWVPGRSRSSDSQDPKARDRVLRSWNSHHNLNSSEAGDHQEHPESGDVGLQTPNHGRSNIIPMISDADRGRPLTRGRYYASPMSNYSGHAPSSPSSETSRGSASSDEVPVEGGVALTEEAVETHIPDIITQV